MLLALYLVSNLSAATPTTTPSTKPPTTPTATSKMYKAVADLEAKSGSKTTGTVTFSQAMPPTAAGTPETGTTRTQTGKEEPLHVTIRLQNATPGNHAVFLHTNGDCSAPDASSVGDYYSATSSSGTMPGSGTTMPSARPGGTTGEPGTTEPGATPGTMPGTTTPGATAGQPAGYIGFVTVNADGKGEKEMTTMGWNLAPGAMSLANRAVVVYEKAPDFTKGGTADAGAKQACGVVKMQAPGALGQR